MLLGALIFSAVIICLTNGILGESGKFRVKYGYKDLTKYETGNSSIIISSGHGGLMQPRGLQPRENGCLNGSTCVYNYQCQPKTTKCKVTTVTDAYTADIAMSIANELRNEGIYPHVITLNLKRTLIDVNRPIDQACNGRSECENFYESYHRFIEEARNATRGTVAIYFDIHGQKHPANWTELGYRITKSELNSGDYNNIRSSINHLKLRSGLSLKELFTGESSFGKMLSKLGYRTVPSPKFPSPGKKGYYRGGYCTQIYGSQIDGGCTDAIQIEIPNTLRNYWNVAKVSKDLASTIKSFATYHKYGDPSWTCGASQQCAEDGLSLMCIEMCAILRERENMDVVQKAPS